MDYTLAIYNQEAMDRLSIQATVDKLIKNRGYPEFLSEVRFNAEFPVRGILIDKRYGNILKMDRFKHVQRGYHGYRALTKEELRDLYHSKRVRPATSRYHWVDTLYALSEACVYAGAIEMLEAKKFAFDYMKLFSDIRECIDEAHRDGTILDAVSGDLPKYIDRDPELPGTLHKLRSAGKRLFVLTNSRLSYTEKMMTYLLGGALAEYPSWKNYFDIAVVAASKPSFFQDARPLLQRQGDIVKPAEFPLERGRVYEGGNLAEFERALNVQSNQVVYVGDHIYGDILRSKKDSAWRTIMVIQELDNEIHAHDAREKELADFDRLQDEREAVEDELRSQQLKLKNLSRQSDVSGKLGTGQEQADLERASARSAIERLRASLKEIDRRIEEIAAEVDAAFHPFWGSLLKERNELSSFGAQVEEYACLYTSKVSNLRHYSPHQSFRGPRDTMAHELTSASADPLASTSEHATGKASTSTP